MNVWALRLLKILNALFMVAAWAFVVLSALALVIVILFGQPGGLL